MYTLYKILGSGCRIIFLLFCVVVFIVFVFIVFSYDSPIDFLGKNWIFLIIGWYGASWIDRRFNPFYNRDVMTPEEHELFRQASFELFGYIARGRGTVIKSQIDFLQNAIAGLPSEEQRELHRRFAMGKEDDEPGPNCAYLVQFVHGNRHLLHQFIEMCVYLVVCDGVLEEEEQRRLMTVSRLIGVADYVTERFVREQMGSAHFNFFRQNYEQNQQQQGSNNSGSYNSGNSYNNEGTKGSSRAHVYNDDFQNALAVFGVKEGTPFSDIKRAYHKLVNRYHPDRVANQGEEIQKVYTEKLKTLNEAYEVVKARYGVK